MTSFITLNGKRTEIESPDANKLCMEITRLITASGYWQDKRMVMLMRICLKAREHKKMAYGHPKAAVGKEKDFNMFYSDNYASEGRAYSMFVTSVCVMINDREVSPEDAYILLVKTDMCRFKKNNPFGVKRKGNIIKGFQYYT